MTHVVRPPFAATSGAANPRIVIVGEAWGESEARTGRPFAGQSGRELFRMLGEAMLEIEPELHVKILDLADKYGDAWVGDRQAWLEAAGIAMTNVLAFRPPGNGLENLCSPKKEVGPYAASFPSLSRGQYLREEYLPELDRLFAEIKTWQPNLVLALGNTACWALLQVTNIGSIRGAITQSISLTPGTGDQVLVGASVENRGHAQNSAPARVQFKVLPTYHPAGVMRQWAWRPIVVADLMKANRESAYPDIRRPSRRVLVSPTIEEMLAWEQETYRLRPAKIASDTETEAKQITMIGFARSKTEAMVIPFWDRTKPGYSYWPTAYEEKIAWDCAERLLCYDCTKIFQNGMYDYQYITKVGIKMARLEADTMLLHHSLFPEMQKGLAFLGSVYTNEISWKLWRKRKSDTVKADE